MNLFVMPNSVSFKNDNLPKNVLDALNPDVLILDTIFPYGQNMALASLDFNVKLHVAQPWQKETEFEIKKKASSVSVFHESPFSFFQEPENYLVWLKKNVSHVSMIKNNDSKLTRMIEEALKDKTFFIHEE